MIKVYVWIGSDDDAELLGVFSTPEKAREAVDDAMVANGYQANAQRTGGYLGWTQDGRCLTLKLYNFHGQEVRHLETVEIATVDRKR